MTGRTIDPKLPNYHARELQASVKHWKENEERYEEGGTNAMHLGSKYCECCNRSDIRRCEERPTARMCEFCAIGQYTLYSGCLGTPYEEVIQGHVPPSVMTRWLEDLLYGDKPPVLLDFLMSDYADE